ncbi:FadR/GntR family transcriptional regulator [Rhizobium herbae]|uniref:DNA-binding FadR family transcriptional regulator n=1 Tax=Rhizobium herbae TaxID=508661 RepID=A0ABS4ELF9_9HYPH|nr:FCD domain-containing protein [Rhizobium herbae]MBP1858666.1 DNA-binding FadR family transcriptional regulator [Rhizobium herbae]
MRNGMEDGARASAVDGMVQHIRGLIRERGLTVGDVLPSEGELAVMFDASRNTVREAFRTLKAYGVAESRQKVGAVLTDQHQLAMRDLFSFAMDISVDAFRDIQGYRRLTEMNLFDLLAGRISPETLEEMEALNRRIRESITPEEASDLDYQFHKLMVDAAGNRTLSETYGMLKPVIRRLMLAGKSQRPVLETVAAEHADIIQALRERDRIAFAYHMNRHLDAGLEFIPAAGTPGSIEAATKKNGGEGDNS